MTIGGDDFYYEPLLSSPVFDAPPASVHRGPLHPGACWEGVQRSGRNVYKVKVDISTVDLTEGKLSGMLQIRHLTPELESLVTFFEGEIIGDKTGFLTSRWGASEADDMKHWSRFPAFSKALRSSLVKPNLTFKHSNRPFLFMRWKEQFVVPSSHAQNIHGASFAGFYYLCLDFDMPSDGAYAPPESARTSSPPLRGAARTRSMSSEISQATLGSARSSMLASPTQHATVFEDESADGIRSPSAHEARPPLPTPAPPAQPRRASNSGFSYASAVRGPTSSLQLSGTSTSHGTSSSISDIAMPKEVESTDTGVASASLGGSNSGATSNASSTSGLFTSMPPLLSTVPLPISIPTLIGTTSDDFPAPSSPPLGTHASFGALPTARHSGMTSPSMSSSTSGGSTVLGSRGIRNTIDSAVLVSEAGEGHSARQRSRSFNTASNRPDGPNERRSSMNRTSGSEKASMNWGYQSWMNCEIKGFYFFRHSEPYQELSLRYVPKTRGTTQAFAFR